MEKLIITAAMVGAEITRQEQPQLPLTAAEIGAAAYDCYCAGASIIHLHVRQADGMPTQDPALFQAAMAEIKSRCDVIVQLSTGGAVGMSAEERIAPVQLRPEMATLTTGSVNFGNEVFVNHPRDIAMFAQQMLEHGVKPELEVFDMGMVATAKQLLQQGLVKVPLHFDFVMGVPGGIAGTPQHLLTLVDALPAHSTWTVAGIGRTELPLGVMAILLGGHVRVGFEDNIYYTRGVLAESNAQLVERMARLSRELGREVASPAEARLILGLA